MKGPKSRAVWPAHIPRWFHPLLQWWWPGTQWATEASQAVHLTFDDGPHPEITPWVLDQLQAHQMTATFFVLGAAARSHSDIIKRTVAQGHAVGGHTMNHEHGWHTDTAAYVQSAKTSMEVGHDGRSLFRPPFGKITRTQCLALLPYAQIVMWDVLSGDYVVNGNRGEEIVLRRLKRHTRPGSIVVFHDNEKCGATIKKVLPEYLLWLQQKGWTSTHLEAKVSAQD